MIAPTYEQLIGFMQRLDHHLVEKDVLHYKDPLAHELEELLEAAGAHYDQQAGAKPGTDAGVRAEVLALLNKRTGRTT